MIATTHAIPSGFQQTEVGVFPDHWEVDAIINHCEYADYRGKTPAKTQSGTFLITARNVRKGYIDYEESQEFVPTALYDQIMARGKPRIGDVLITTEAPLGNVAQVDREDVALAQRIIKYRPRTNGLSSNYLKHFLLSDTFQRLLTGRGSGTTATGIKGSVLHQLPIAIPPLHEQEAIAEALGDADAWIESLEQLLAKKRHLKQAAMQQLLTGKKRLPGFEVSEPSFRHTLVGSVPADWDLPTVGDEYDIQLGKMLDTEKNTGVPKPYLGNRAVHWGHIDVSDLSTMPMSNSDLTKFRLKHGDLLVCEGGEVGRAAIWNSPIEECYYQKALHRLRARNGFNSRLMIAFLNKWSDDGRLMNFVTQTSIAHLPKDKFVTIPLPKPSIAEQTAIAEVLSDMDAEITAIESKLAKARQIKQGMMQELLTGRTRLREAPD